MNFFKNILPTAATKTLIKSTVDYDIYTTKESNSDITIFKYKNNTNGNNAIQILKSIKHTNIISIQKSKSEKLNCYIKTEQLFLFNDYYQQSFFFNFCGLCVIAEVLVFLKRCNISHNDISFDCLYINETGKIIVGNFEYARKEESENDDLIFINLIEKFKKEYDKNIYKEKEIIKIKNNTFDFVNDNFFEKRNKEYIKNALNASYFGFEDFYKDNKDFYEKTFYKKYECSIIKFKIMTKEEKEEFLDLILQNYDFLVELAKIKILDLYIYELNTENEKFKSKILYAIFYLNLKNYEKQVEILFRITDPKIRDFLMSNIDLYIEKILNWNENIFKMLVYDLKSENIILKRNCIVLIQKISLYLNNKNIKEAIKFFYMYVKDEKSVEEVHFFIKNNFDRIKESKSLTEESYRLILTFLSYDKTRNQTLSILYKFYLIFDIKKLQLEVVPILCTLLSDKENQDICFELIESIVKHLKNNSAVLIGNEWGVKKLGKVFNNVSFGMPKFLQKKTVEKEINKELNVKKNNEKGDDWDTEW